MAGFFLVQNQNNTIHLDRALNAFMEKGLKAPSKHKLGTHTLFLFDKLTADSPYLVETKKGFCAAVGAYVYKKLNYYQSLVSTLDDYIQGSLDYSEMYGQYTVILYTNEQIQIITDPLSAKHVFSNRQYSFFSSSFFAAASSIDNITINNMAVFEKLLTGIIVSPDTLVNEIVQIDRDEQIKVNLSKCGVTFLIHSQIDILPDHNQGKKESVNEQVKCIRRYFDSLKTALTEERVDLGLSAGHDSTLIFAAISSSFNEKIHVHTHSTGHVHDREKDAAVAMAKVKGITPTIIPTPRLDDTGINLKKLLQENLLFFDGRTSHDIGGFSATYRAQYRLKATDGCLSTLSGVGGECLRNHYSVKGNKLDADQFFLDKVFNRSFIEAAPDVLIQRVKRYHIEKAEKKLKVNLHGRVDRINLRRYYSEVLMPDGQGNVIDAYNTVSKCIAPFLDPHILKEAYRGIRYLGNCGEYESKIISSLDSQIGTCINANNGYPFDHIPLSLRIKEELRALISSKTWEKLSKIKSGGLQNSSDRYFYNVADISEDLSKAFSEMRSKYPEINFDIVIKGYAMDALVEYLALTMRKLSNEKQFN